MVRGSGEQGRSPEIINPINMAVETAERTIRSLPGNLVEGFKAAIEIVSGRVTKE